VLVVWAGTQHANDAEFDALFRKHLTGIYLALGQMAPEELAKPIKRQPERAYQLAPSTFLNVKVDGRDTSYFEWLGAGVFSPEHRGGTMHGRTYYLRELRYGFEEERFCGPRRLLPGQAHGIGGPRIPHHHRRRA